MTTQFVQFNLKVEDINVSLDDLLEMLHEDGADGADSPVAYEAEEVFQLLPEIADIRGGYLLMDDFQNNPQEGKMTLEGRVISPDKKVCSLMKGAELMAIVVCTAGKGFTEYSKRYNKEGEYLKCYVVDALGSIVAEKSVEYIQSQLEKAMLQEGKKITNRYSPGYCNWPVDDQKHLFSILPENVCDIHLSPSCLMDPIKSVSGIVGVGADVERKDYACEICTNTKCVYRKVKNKNKKL